MLAACMQMSEKKLIEKQVGRPLARGGFYHVTTIERRVQGSLDHKMLATKTVEICHFLQNLVQPKKESKHNLYAKQPEFYNNHSNL